MGLLAVRVGINVDSVLTGQSGQSVGPALAHRPDPPSTAAAVDLQEDHGREPGKTRRGERELLLALHPYRQAIQLAVAVAVRCDDDAFDGGWEKGQIEAQCLFREDDSAARVAGGVVENKIGINPDLASVVEKQGDKVDLRMPRKLQEHVHGDAGDGDVLAGDQIHTLCHCPFDESKHAENVSNTRVTEQLAVSDTSSIGRAESGSVDASHPRYFRANARLRSATRQPHSVHGGF